MMLVSPKSISPPEQESSLCPRGTNAALSGNAQFFDVNPDVHAGVSIVSLFEAVNVTYNSIAEGFDQCDVEPGSHPRRRQDGPTWNAAAPRRHETARVSDHCRSNLLVIADDAGSRNQYAQLREEEVRQCSDECLTRREREQSLSCGCCIS
jgi:hypothetical protein